MAQVDPAFINPTEIRPKTQEIPTIDLSSVSALDHLPATIVDSDIVALVADIGRACQKWGFFQVINHGIPLEKIEKMHQITAEFFSQSKEEKRKVGRCIHNQFGYYDEDYSENVREWKEAFGLSVKDSPLPLQLPDDPLFQLRNRWPENPPQFRDEALAYGKEITKLALKLLELIELSLGLAPHRLINFFEDPASFLLLHRYVACPSPELVIGNGAHKDSGAIILVSENNVSGIQVKRRSDGEWASIVPVPGAFVVNIGDILQVWTNDKYLSVEHRVGVNPNKDRVSLSFHFGPAYHYNIKPLEEFVDEQNPPKHKEYNYGEFRAAAFKSNVTKPGFRRELK